MKKVLMIAASLAIVAGLASCQKENFIDNGGNGGNGEDTKTGTITATFAKPATKVNYTEVKADEDKWDLQPHWDINDIIVGINANNEVFELKVRKIESDVAILDIVGEDDSKCEGSVTLFYKTGLRADGWDSNNKQFVVNLNGQKGDKTMPAIMMATGTIDKGAGKFTFDNSGAVLGIFSVGDALKGKTIKQVTLFGKKLASSATLDKTNGVKFNYPENNGYNVISTGILSGINVGDDGKVKQNSEDKPILMAVPAEAQVDSVFIRTIEGEVYSLGSSNKVAMAANNYRYIKDATFVRDANRDDMILTGVFTVSKDGGTTKKQVFFSKGNLWADGDYALHFEPNQYSFSNGSGHVSNFSWSSTVAEAASGNVSGGYFFCDEDNKESVDESGKIYYALSKDEWSYLLNTRTMANGGTRCDFVSSAITVETVSFKGLVLFPDNFTEQATWKTKYTTWEALNNAGLVFLPLTSGSILFYWTSSHFDDGGAYSLLADDYNRNPSYQYNRHQQLPVRLVSDCK